MIFRCQFILLIELSLSCKSYYTHTYLIHILTGIAVRLIDDMIQAYTIKKNTSIDVFLNNEVLYLMIMTSVFYIGVGSRISNVN